MPRPKAPPDLVRGLEAASRTLRERGMADIAGELEALQDAIRSMLELTRYGDCLFGDEIRNLFGMRHALRPRRGTSEDPMKGRRKARRIRKRTFR
jgi:hypothetical protein